MRFVFFLYGLVCYLVFFGTFLYAIGFLADWLVPRSVDRGLEATAGRAILIDLLLLSLFALQHSVMARIGFKAWWTKIVPPPVERSTYVLFTSLVLCLLFWQWRPLADPVWAFESAPLRAAIHGLYGLGWGLVLYATCLIDHFDLFGLRQVTSYLKGREYAAKTFVTPSLYKLIRHPLYLGWITVFWAAPVMTRGHLLFSAVASLYILVAIRFEERDLLRFLGDDYRAYREKTPMIVPGLGRRSKA